MTSVSDVIQLTTEALSNIAVSNTSLTGAVGTANSDFLIYLDPCIGYDNLILDKIDQINVKKQQIVSLLTANYDKLVVNCGIATKNPGVPGISSGSFIPASGIKSDACLLETSIISIASTAVVSGTLTTFNYNCQLFTGPGPGFGTTTQCDIGVKGEVRKETLYALVYPYLENMTISVDDWTGIGPLDGPTLEVGGEVGVKTHIGIGTTTPRNNLGIGKSVFQFTDIIDPKSIHKNQSELIGYYYPINDPGCGTTITTAVQTLENEIITIRAGISTLIPVANGPRVLKMDAQVDKWWITKVQSSDSGTASAIGTLNNDLNNIPYTT